MAKQRPTDSGLPRRQPGKALADDTPIEPHRHGDTEHRHRMGQLPHDHDEDGRPVFHAVAKLEPARVEPPIQAEDDDVRRFVAKKWDEDDPDTDVLPAAAVPSVPGGQATADPSPPDVPEESGDASATSPPIAGSDDSGAGRLLKPWREWGPEEREQALANRVTPDATESVFGAAMGVINPAAEPGFAITHAEESARVLIMGQHFANMLKAIAPPYVQLVEESDARGMWRLLRKIAATHGWDLDAEDGAS